MKYIFSILFVFVFCNYSYAAEQHHSRPKVEAKYVTNAPRATVSADQFAAMTSDTSLAKRQVEMVDVIEDKKVVDDREAERLACESNNIGIGNTFVWASKFSNTLSYSSMVEDVEHPENNVCFVRVELKSDNSKISVSDIDPQYFMWGENITCGSWANEDVMRQRILDAKKGARVGGIIASTVGGLGVGVGSMELFGNKLIGGKVMGQEALSGNALYRSQLLVLKEKQDPRYAEYVQNLKDLKNACTTNRDELKTACGGKDCCDKYQKLMDEFAY